VIVIITIQIYRTDALTLISFQVTQFAVQPGRASLARVAPAFANSGATQLSCADYSLKTRQALVILHFGKTGPGSGMIHRTSLADDYFVHKKCKASINRCHRQNLVIRLICGRVYVVCIKIYIRHL
jgi:hypothetical protein